VGGLYRQCSPPAPGTTTFARSWVLKTPVWNSRSELGPGPYPEITARPAASPSSMTMEPVKLRRCPPLKNQGKGRPVRRFKKYRQIWLSISSSICGVPCFARWEGEAQALRGLANNLRSVRFAMSAKAPTLQILLMPPGGVMHAFTNSKGFSPLAWQYPIQVLHQNDE